MVEILIDVRKKDRNVFFAYKFMTKLNTNDLD